MRHQLAQRHRPLFLRELGDVRLNVFVEIQPAFLQQQADCGRRDRSGGGTDPELHFWRDGHPLLEIRPAETLRPHDVAADPHCHRESRQILIGKTQPYDLSSLLHGVGPLWRRGGMDHRWRVLRVRVQRRRSGAHVRPEPHDRYGDQTYPHDDQCQPGFGPVPRHALRIVVRAAGVLSVR